MSNYRNRSSEPAPNNPPSGNPPTHVAKIRIGQGDAASFERIGVAWIKDDGSLFVRVSGTQVIAGGFALYPVEEGGAR